MTTNKQHYWYAAAGVFFVLFAIIAFFVATNEATLSAFDNPIIHLVRGNLTDGKTSYFSLVTRFGDTLTVVILTIVSAALLYLSKAKISAYWLILNAFIIQGGGNTALKLIFDRPRPSGEHLVSASGTSFPSGHSMGSMLLYGTLIILLPQFIKNKPLRILIQILLGCLILLVGTSRIYLGVHYPSDVLGGFLAGACWLALSYPMFKKFNTQ